MTKRDEIMIKARECLARHRNAKRMAKEAAKRGDTCEQRFLEDSAKNYMNAVKTWRDLACDID